MPPTSDETRDRTAIHEPVNFYFQDQGESQ